MTIIASAEPATASRTAAQSRRARVHALLGALWLILFFASLFSPPVLDDADGTHASAARQMALAGDWVTLRVNNVRYLEKAPLPYWLAAASIRVFGYNTFAVHLPEALDVLLLMLLGVRWAREAFGEQAALYTGLGVLTSAGVFLFTRVFIPDVLLSLLLACALYCLLRALSAAADEHAPSPLYTYPMWAYLMWTALALAVLTKGLVAPVFLFDTAIVYMALAGELGNWRRLKPLSGGLIFLAIAAPWHILAGLRNTGGMDGHGFFWFYFINEQVLRFLGRRIPMDYNKLPGYLYWSLNLVWLFPWSVFLPLGIVALYRRYKDQKRSLVTQPRLPWFYSVFLFFAAVAIVGRIGLGITEQVVLGLTIFFIAEIAHRRHHARLALSPFHELDAKQRTVLMLFLFSALVLIFFSLSTNQEYYTFPVYLPALMLLAACLARAEARYDEDKSSRRWISFAHAAFATIGVAVAAALTYGLWTSRQLAFVPDIGDLLAHRGVGDYTLSMSSLFDLTGRSFAALRLPAGLALATFSIGPAVAWILRTRRRHLAATTAMALTSAVFLIAAHIAFVRFAPMLSSADMATRIQQLEATGAISRDNTLLLYGDQAYGSSLAFYLDRPLSRPALLVDGRSSSMLFGSTFPDAQRLFLTPADLLAQWGKGPRKLLFVPLEQRDEVDRLLGARQVLLQETSGKALITDRPLNSDPADSYDAGPSRPLDSSRKDGTP